jgi:hypothetical protein
MKEWVVEFLRLIGDRNISPQELDRELKIAQFCRRRLVNLFKNNLGEGLIDVVGSVLGDLSAATFFDLITKQNLLFAEFHDLGGVFLVPASDKDSAVILMGPIQELSFSVARGVVAHELPGHIKLGHHQEKVKRVSMEQEADASATAEGFGDDIQLLRNFKGEGGT